MTAGEKWLLLAVIIAFSAVLISVVIVTWHNVKRWRANRRTNRNLNR